jgi:hypothetical protein
LLLLCSRRMRSLWIVLVPLAIAALWYFSWSVQWLQIAIGVIGIPIVFGAIGYAAWQGIRRQRWEKQAKQGGAYRDAAVSGSARR